MPKVVTLEYYRRTGACGYTVKSNSKRSAEMLYQLHIKVCLHCNSTKENTRRVDDVILSKGDGRVDLNITLRERLGELGQLNH